MKAIEKLQNNFYVCVTESRNTHRRLIQTNDSIELNVTLENINLTYNKSLCELCNEIYGIGEDYNERMKNQAIDVKAGYISAEEIEILY